ncbi:MAG: hypothetical protein JSS72_13500 [Armatimonadetes bacterium]|nr:hypothetical protein [Armatimonadota bacterium]
MKGFSKFLLFLAALAGIVFVATFPVRGAYASRAKMIQRVQVDKQSDDLFGDGGTPIGSPQMMIIDDPKAFLPTKSADGAEQVSDNYLKQNNIYPLQLQTVDFFARYTRLASGAAFVILFVLGYVLGRRVPRKGDEAASPGNAS